MDKNMRKLMIQIIILFCLLGVLYGVRQSISHHDVGRASISCTEVSV